MSANENGQVDVLIVGGGLVGSSLAIALGESGQRVALAEAFAPHVSSEPVAGERHLALASASVQGLASIGVWPHVATRANPIRKVHVSRAGEFGALRLDAAEQGVDSLGHTLPARQLGAGLARRLQDCAGIQRLTPARLVSLEPVAGGWRAALETGQGRQRTIEARLVVGADGTHSSVRDLLGIECDRFDYRQTVFVCTAATERPHEDRAFERFGDHGPAALLPLAGGQCGLVMAVPGEQAEEVAALDDGAYLALAAARLGNRLGRLSAPGKRHRHEVMRVAARSLTGPRAVLLGNAAQTVHPIGAQGFNLGLRDALTLAELLVDHDDPGSRELLAEYARRRTPDRDGVMAFSHGLIRLACLPQPILGPLRSLALVGMDAIPALRRSVARRGMGYRGEPPRAVLLP